MRNNNSYNEPIFKSRKFIDNLSNIEGIVKRVDAFAEINFPIYLKMQGPSEFGIVGNASLKDWDVTQELNKINVPFLSIGAEHDTMDPKQMEWMANEVQNWSYLHCPKGSHMAMWDDLENYFNGLISYK
tara:strand:- start:601 stop:987 length:387 start_codon:yes stop_codon:yes gene_type:complete